MLEDDMQTPPYDEGDEEPVEIVDAQYGFDQIHEFLTNYRPSEYISIEHQQLNFGKLEHDFHQVIDNSFGAIDALTQYIAKPVMPGVRNALAHAPQATEHSSNERIVDRVETVARDIVLLQSMLQDEDTSEQVILRHVLTLFAEGRMSTMGMLGGTLGELPLPEFRGAIAKLFANSIKGRLRLPGYISPDTAGYESLVQIRTLTPDEVDLLEMRPSEHAPFMVRAVNQFEDAFSK